MTSVTPAQFAAATRGILSPAQVRRAVAISGRISRALQAQLARVVRPEARA